MIVRNEAANLPRCLGSVQGLVDEIIIVDTGSTDGTQALAFAHGARLIQSTWRGNFSASRNESLEAVTAKWILVLDADEELTASGARQIREAIAAQEAQGTPAAFTLVNNSTSDGGRTGMRARLIRLFPALPGLRFEWPVHEQVATALQRLGIPVRDCEAEVLHHGYNDAARNLEKQRRNISILQRQLSEGSGAGALSWFLLGGAHLDLSEYVQALDAYARVIATAAEGTDLHEGARVRSAECRFRLGQFAAVFDEAQRPAVALHPDYALCALRTSLALGRLADADAWLARLLDAGPGPWFPPCNPASAASLGLRALAEHWHAHGNSPLGVRLLRLALEAAAGRLPRGFRL